MNNLKNILIKVAQTQRSKKENLKFIPLQKQCERWFFFFSFLSCFIFTNSFEFVFFEMRLVR